MWKSCSRTVDVSSWVSMRGSNPDDCTLQTKYWPSSNCFFFLSFFAGMATHWQRDRYDRQKGSQQKWHKTGQKAKHMCKWIPTPFFFLHAACKTHTMPCAMLIYSLKSTSVLLNRPTCSALAVATLLVHSPTEYGRHALRFSCSEAKHNSCECLCCTLLRD